MSNPPESNVCLPREEFEVIYRAIKMVAVGEDYTTVEAVRLERAAWQIVSKDVEQRCA